MMETVMDICVGEKPKPISYGALQDFNKVFLRMFEHFKEGHDQIEQVWMEYNREDPLAGFGDLTISNVRRWLKYNQLITVEERKEPLEKPDGFRKNRTVRTLKPTKRGWFVYENGDLIEVDVGYGKFKVGIGLPYSYWRELEGLAYAVWNQQRIAQSRQQKWFSELKSFWEKLVDKKSDEAKNLMFQWASEKAFEWNKNRKVRRKLTIKKPPTNPETGEVVLPKQQQTLRLFSGGGNVQKDL